MRQENVLNELQEKFTVILFILVNQKQIEIANADLTADVEFYKKERTELEKKVNFLAKEVIKQILFNSSINYLRQEIQKSKVIMI